MAIDNGAVVGLFQGRMEYGPRALGNRSILARATDVGINDDLNRRLSRSEFMPFAPVTLAEHAADCYVDWTPRELMSRHMTSCYTCTPRMRRETPAVVHVDGTARPQIIRRDDNPFYYDIVNAYSQRTGDRDTDQYELQRTRAPIVCTPEQAVDVLTRSAIDLLVMPRSWCGRRPRSVLTRSAELSTTLHSDAVTGPPHWLRSVLTSRPSTRA